jgi:xanthine/uracil permease
MNGSLGNAGLQRIEESHAMFFKAYMNKFEVWKELILFSWQWWFGVLLSFVLVILWLKIRRKDSTDRLIYAGIMVASLATFLDITGTFFGLWKYSYEVLPWGPWYFPWDYVLIPISVMLLLQVKPNVSPLLKALLFATVSTFIGLPVFDFLGLYQPLEWKYIYSFPIQVIIYLVGHYFAYKRKYYAEL